MYYFPANHTVKHVFYVRKFQKTNIYCILHSLKENVIVMKKSLQILKIIQLFIFLPFEISKGSKRRAYMRIKKMMISANLL
jgi:hypothetical protein